MKSTCSRCGNGYSPGRYPGSGSFCMGCSKAINDEANAAALHRKKIMAGDPYELPENPAEAREVRRAIRSRLTSQPDCQYKHKKVAS